MEFHKAILWFLEVSENFLYGVYVYRLNRWLKSLNFSFFQPLVIRLNLLVTGLNQWGLSLSPGLY